MIDLNNDHLETVREILNRHLPYQRVVVFGSRVKGKVKKYSDLDLCVMGNTPLSLEILSNLREDFSESDLPIRVDIVDWATIDPEFRTVIQEQCEDITPLRKTKTF